MTDEQLRECVLATLQEAAPNVDLGTLDEHTSFRDQFEIDSIDFVRFVLALEKQLNMKIPETDFPRLSSLKGSLTYLQSHPQGQP